MKTNKEIWNELKELNRLYAERHPTMQKKIIADLLTRIRTLKWVLSNSKENL